MNYSWLIMGGCPRSGTTLLNFVVNTHPYIQLSNEQDLYRTLTILDTCFYREKHIINRAPRKLTAKEEAVGAYESEVDLSTIKRDKSLAPALRALYANSLLEDPARSDSMILGDKLPKYYKWDLKHLLGVLGNVAFIHVTRAPIDVLESCVHRTRMSLEGKDWWPIRSLADYIDEWIFAWNFAYENRHNQSFLHLKYEHFTSNPADTMSDVSKFLEVENLFDVSNVFSKPHKTKSTDPKMNKLAQKFLPEEIVAWSDSVPDLMEKVGPISPPKGYFDTEMVVRYFQRRLRNHGPK